MRAGAQPSDAPVPATTPRVEIAPIAPVGKVAPVAPIQVAPIGGSIIVAPIAGIAIPSAPDVALTPLGFDAQAIKTPILVARLRSHQITPQQAYDAGEMSADDALDVLQWIDWWGGFHWGKEVELRRQIVAVVVNNAPKAVENPAPLAPFVRLWLADYYESIRDERCLALAEGILKELPQPLPSSAYNGGDFPLAFQAVERIGWFYRDTGKHQKSADAWLRMSDYCPQKGWWTGDMRLLAARSLEQDGQHAKATEMRAKVADVGDGWLTILSFYDEALPLLDAGKLDEAQAVLSRPIGATTRAREGQIAQNAWLASVAYRKGDLGEALRLGRENLDLAASAETVEDGPVRNLYNMATDIYNRAGGWRTQPIQTDTQEVVFQANPSHPEAPLYARFRIKTYGDTSVTASVDNPNIQARVLPVDNWQRDDLSAREEEMEVIVQSNSLRPFSNVPLTLSSATRGKTTTVRVSLADASA